MTSKATKEAEALAASFEAAWDDEQKLPNTATNAEIDAAVARTAALFEQVIAHPKATSRMLARAYLWRQEPLAPELETLFERLGALRVAA